MEPTPDRAVACICHLRSADALEGAERTSKSVSLYRLLLTQFIDSRGGMQIGKINVRGRTLKTTINVLHERIH